MSNCRYLYCAVLCFITTLKFTVVNAIGDNVRSEKFKHQSSTVFIQTENTTDVYSESMISCAGICLSDPRCCVASYSKGTSTCRIDTSEQCCVGKEPNDGWKFIEQKSYRKYM